MCEKVPWPIKPGPEALMALVAGVFSSISGICLCLLKLEMREEIFFLGIVLNVLNTTVLFGTPAIICSNSAVRLFFTGETE